MVVAGGFLGAVVVVVLGGDGDFAGGELFGGAVAVPEFVGGGELGEGEFAGDGGGAAGAVVFEKGVAIAAVGEGEIEQFGIFEGLLHAGADGVGVVFGLDHGQAEVGFVIQQIIGLAGGPALDGPAADDHPAGGEVDLFAELGQDVPFGSVWRPDNRGGDVLRPDVGFAELAFVHGDAGGDGGGMNLGNR